MLVGPAIISNTDPGWPQSLALFRRAGANVARVPTGTGFLNTPAVLEDLINAGAQMVVLNVEKYWPDNARPDVEQGHGVQTELAPYLPVIDRHPGATIVVELGNEPDQVANVAIPQARQWLLTTLIVVKPRLARANLRWAVSLPTTLPATRALLARDATGSVLDALDVVCTHLYGFTQLSDGGNTDELTILHEVLATTRLPVVLSEVGIDDRSTSPAEKARRYLAWAATADPRVEAMCIWDLGRWQPNPTYDWTPDLADILSARATPEPPPPVDPFAPVPDPHAPDVLWFPPTQHTLRTNFRSFWERFGGLAIFGFPISEEFVENGVTVQYTERQRFERHPGTDPQHFDVELGLLGREVAKVRYGKG